jgi:ubiquinol-cytochrome c reductase iron-sulfur subunit
MLRQGNEESGFGRRSLIRRSLVGALGALPLSAIVLLRDLGPLPRKKLRHTAWNSNSVLINENTGQPLKPSDIQLGTLASARPNDLVPGSENYDTELAKAAVVLVRIAPEDIHSQAERDAGWEGIVCFSKICTHVGCPVGLYEQQTHHLLCPCHQSTFDLTDGGKVIFGPAARSLPQLAIEVDQNGNLKARGDFTEPVGPSFWERG